MPPRGTGPCEGDEGEDEKLFPNMAKNRFLFFFSLVGLTVVIVVVNGGMVCDARMILVVDDPVSVDELASAAVGEEERKEDVEELDKRGGKLIR